ncbi:MAG: hypothetical protein ABI431_05180 [Candidatus Tumulicola sp.]
MLHASAASTPPAYRTPARSHVSVTFVSCGPRSASTVSFIATPSGTVVASGTLQRQPSRLQTYSATLNPGYYTVVAGVLPCTTSHELVVLPGKNRSVVLRGQDQLSMRAGPGGLAGTFPENGVRIIANCAEMNEGIVRYTAIIQDGAYYFDSIRSPATCDLSVLSGESDEKPLYLLHKIVVTPHAIVRRDIDWTDLSSGARPR